jgi:hypothetical protein
MPLIFHWGGPRDRQVAHVPAAELRSSVLVYDGPHWLGVYERLEPPAVLATEAGQAEVWVVRE